MTMQRIIARESAIKSVGGSNAGLVEAQFPIVCSLDGLIALRAVNPGVYVDGVILPGHHAAAGHGAEALQAAATESGGSATATCAATAGYHARFSAIEMVLRQATETTPQANALATLTFYQLSRNAMNVGDGFSDNAATATSVVASSSLTFRFDCPADGREHRLYIHPSARINGRTVLTPAMLRKAVATGPVVPAEANLIAALTSLASGSGLAVTITPLYPGVDQYEQYMEWLAAQGWL